MRLKNNHGFPARTPRCRGRHRRLGGPRPAGQDAGFHLGPRVSAGRGAPPHFGPARPADHDRWLDFKPLLPEGKLVTDADLLLWTQRIVDGEAARLTAAAPGAAAIAWPSAAEVAALCATFQAQAGPQSEAKDRTDREQSDVEQLVPEVLAAIKDLWDTIEFTLRFEASNPSRRRRAREWGVYYATRPGETPDPEAPTPPPPTEPTP